MEAPQKTTFINALKETVDRCGSRVFATWYDGEGRPVNSFTYERMWSEAGAIA